MKLVIVRGVPGTGKSTYAKTLGIAHFEADMYFYRNGKYEWDRRELGKAHGWCQSMVEASLIAGCDVVVSNTFSTMKEMRPYLEMASALNATVEVVELTEVYGNIHDVPDQIIDMMRARWEAYDPNWAPEDLMADITDVEVDATEIVDRKDLSMIATILDLKPIEGKDRIEFCKVLGYTGVVEKGIHQVGDTVLVTRYDSIVPEIPMFEFMRASKFRVKTKKFNTDNGPVYSQVIIVPLTMVADHLGAACPREITIGDDFTDIMGVKKWIPKQQNATGTQFGNMKPKGTFPTHLVSKTDEMNVQSKPGLIKELTGHAYYITEKADGSSMTCLIDPATDEFLVCSRNMKLHDCENNAFWEAAKKYKIEECLRAQEKPTAIQAELVGGRIQGNKLGLDGIEIRVFNIIDMESRRRFHFKYLEPFCKDFGLPMVTVLGQGDSFDYTLDQLIGIASRVYSCNKDQQAEGIVVRPQADTFSDILKDSLSFKVMNPEF